MPVTACQTAGIKTGSDTCYKDVCPSMYTEKEFCVTYNERPSYQKMESDLLAEITKSANSFLGLGWVNRKISITTEKPAPEVAKTPEKPAKTGGCEIKNVGFGCVQLESCITYCKPML